ncbi:hypothetical protein D0Z07_0394 [Hyphodiscus hymeniophilus]|uniref:Uncharacterized protein n=1 Tax=Hyphodiscus hymeniophilus TaxID=353542 RepID=A0A9P7B172_9HELO|nr:hypothetical protein D0Z07_0394 [Hyphodiscus hymeniophilus]
MDALSTLYTSVPDWNIRLDELNNQIAQRQIDLARLDEQQREGRAEREQREDRLKARSLRSKGSTESLRPKDGNGSALPSEDVAQLEPDAFVELPKLIQSGFTTQQPTTSPVSLPLRRSNTPPKAAPGAGLARQSSQPITAKHPRTAPAGLKKRKTESLASVDSRVPKYRTRSMIIVYYDSAVQTAFEELVKFVSGSRNAMRKGKMAAKMAEMRRAAELEVAADEDADGDEMMSGTGALLGAQKKVAVGKAGESLLPGGLGDDAGDFTMPKLRYISTRNMGPSRDYTRADNFGSTLSMGLLKGYNRRGGDSLAPDIFDELDKGLEWCQSQCEHAAHQFLRDGDCSQEIENIKRKLVEVKERAGTEMEKLKKEEAETPPKPVRDAISAKGKSRELKSVQMRKDLGTMKDLEVDDLAVDDDEGVDDMEPPKLIFKRSRDVGV